MSAPTFTLRDLVREVIADHPDASPRELAELVAKLAPAERIADLFTDLLVPLVNDVLSQQLRNALNRNFKQKARSPKLEERRRWWHELLAARVHVGGELKVVAECTVEDLSTCIEERRAHIADVQAQIVNYEKLIALMTQHGVETVAELPEQESWEDEA
jgi:hypothetical protein